MEDAVRGMSGGAAVRAKSTWLENRMRTGEFSVFALEAGEGARESEDFADATSA